MKYNRAVIAALVFGLICGTSPAYAKTPKPTIAQIEAAKKAEVAKAAVAKVAADKLAKANQTLRGLTAVANSALSKYIQAQKELAIAIKISKAAALYAQKTANAVLAAHRTIGQLAANAYIMGGALADIEPLLSANGPQDLMDQVSTLSKLGSQNSTALDRYKEAEVVAKAAKRQADEAKASQQRATEKVAEAKKIADQAKAAQQVEVNKLQAVQDKLMKDLASAKRIRITLQQQRQLALLEESQANQAARTPGQKKIWADTGFKGRVTIRSNDAQRANAVAYAKKQVLARKPYIWGAQGPNAYDCSGLVYAAYLSAGLGWPEWGRLNAALYSVATKHVGLNELIPGDLLFYSYKGTIQTIHHITIYAGGGMMWEANSRSKGLLFSNMYSIDGLMPFGGRV